MTDKDLKRAEGMADMIADQGGLHNIQAACMMRLLVEELRNTQIRLAHVEVAAPI